MNIRLLRADEIDVRVQSIKGNGYSVLLYKDARCDMKILDETFGITGWQRKHEVINGNLFCTVSIWDEEKNMWIDKQDVGIETYSAKEKGEASDSFKRACFNVGIGRELYTAPFIWINAMQGEISNYKGKDNVRTNLNVSKIAYNENREIIALEIRDSKGNIRYTFGNAKTPNTGKQTPNRGNPAQNKGANSKDDLIRAINGFVKDGKITVEQVKSLIQGTFNKNNSNELTVQEAQQLLQIIKGA